jgi:predicted nucleotide-binding protein
MEENMYYQVLIETAEKDGKKQQNKEYYELDKTSKQEIIETILIPFIQGTQFQFDGYFLTQKDVKRLVVKTTEKTTKELSQYENDHMSPGILMFITDEMIVNYDKYTKDISKEIIAEARSIITGQKSTSIISQTKNEDISNHKTDFSKVFVVHGRDDLAKTEVARFIEKLGFQAIILHEQENMGMTIIEKIEKFTDVGFGIVLYTPCDIGTIKGQQDFKSRARQNVVFEHGYLIGKLGRNKVTALVKDEVEIPNDISGLVYISMDKSKAWELSIAKEMKQIGYSIDLNALL